MMPRVARAMLVFAPLAVAVAAAGCATSGVVPRPIPGRINPPSEPVSPVSRATAQDVVATVLTLQGVPYRAGGSSPDGFDCSGLVWYAFEHAGVAVPRTVGGQFAAGVPVDRDALEAADLVFFATTGGGATHVAVMIDAELFVHAPSERGVVRADRLTGAYWRTRFVGARRIVSAEQRAALNDVLVPGTVDFIR